MKLASWSQFIGLDLLLAVLAVIVLVPAGRATRPAAPAAEGWGRPLGADVEAVPWGKNVEISGNNKKTKNKHHPILGRKIVGLNKKRTICVVWVKKKLRKNFCFEVSKKGPFEMWVFYPRHGSRGHSPIELRSIQHSGPSILEPTENSKVKNIFIGTWSNGNRLNYRNFNLEITINCDTGGRWSQDQCIQNMFSSLQRTGHG